MIEVLVNKYFEMLKFVDPKGCILKSTIYGSDYGGDYVECIYRQNMSVFSAPEENVSILSTPEKYEFFYIMKENVMLDIINKHELTKFFRFIEKNLKRHYNTMTIILGNSNYEIVFHVSDHFTEINQIDQILESKLKEKILLSI